MELSARIKEARFEFEGLEILLGYQIVFLTDEEHAHEKDFIRNVLDQKLLVWQDKTTRIIIKRIQVIEIKLNEQPYAIKKAVAAASELHREKENGKFWKILVFKV